MHRKLNKHINSSLSIGDRSRIASYRAANARRCAGLTITEVIVASALLIIAMVPILKAMTTAHVSSTRIEQKTRSLTLAQAKLDEIKARSIYSYGASFTENDTSLDGSYLCDVADDSGDPLRMITVSVGYDVDGDSALATDEIEVALTTLVAGR